MWPTWPVAARPPPAAACPHAAPSGPTLRRAGFAGGDVPPSDPAPWEPADIALGRLFAARGRMPARIVIYRRPVETRVDDPRELAALVNEVVVEQVAAMLGV